jgi:hypothetical protein
MSDHETPDTTDVTAWTDLGQSMWSYLTGQQAAINYELVDMEISVPRETGPNSPSAIWRFNGTLRITTSDRDSQQAG